MYFLFGKRKGKKAAMSDLYAGDSGGTLSVLKVLGTPRLIQWDGLPVVFSEMLPRAEVAPEDRYGLGILGSRSL